MNFGIHDTLVRREELVARLNKALAHFPVLVRLSIITAHMPLAALEKLVEFQERKF